MKLYILRVNDLPETVAEREAFFRLWKREQCLSQSVLYVECEKEQTPNEERLSLALIEQLAGLLILTGSDLLVPPSHRCIRLEVRRPTAEEQRGAWNAVLGSKSSEMNGDLDKLVSQFSIGVGGIYAAGQQALEGWTTEKDSTLNKQVWKSCRLQGRYRLDGLAQRIEPKAQWTDLVLPDAQTEILHDICAQVRHRSMVYDQWGFADKGSRGLGLSALFAGPSGTGKTMAAEVLARELELDLYRIDLSQVVDKYIGETEKNLRRLFDAAEMSGAILLFDEADALFGKRSEVKDSHDRFANIEVSYLLQRMENYQGLAILTTNLKDTIDSAFFRRIRFIVRFPFPNADQRTEIWRRIFPLDTPTEYVDPKRLAQLNIAGGNIRNIAMNAAFLAADANEPVAASHILRAARCEYMKIEKTLTESELRGWP